MSARNWSEIVPTGRVWACGALLMACGMAAAAQEEEGFPFTTEAGPATVQLGALATFDVPEGVVFVPQDQMEAFNAATGNLHSPSDVGALISDDGWIVFFSFDDIGYVKDDGEELDAASILASMRENDEPSNELRRERGLGELWTDGWSREPYYDRQTNNLTWGLRLRTGAGDQVINHQIRLLGRRGVMNAIVVDSPDAIETSVASFEPMLSGFHYSEGNRYAEFVKGDRVAQVGLAALVAGGGLAVAAKTGLLGVLGKYLKPILLGIVALFATVGRRIRGFLSRGPASESHSG